MKQKIVMIGAAVVVTLLAAGGWAYFGRDAGAVEKTEAADDAGSALVKTVMVHRQAMPMTMNVFGEVSTGKVESLSFPQAGQIAQLLVLPGQALHRGDVIATLVSDPAAQTAYAQAASALAFAQRELRRNQDLLALQLATQSQVDAASRQMQDAQSVLDAQRKLGGAQGTAQLLAPFDGVVIATVAAQGERVQAGTAVVQLGRNDTLRVQLEIEPTLSAQLHRGMPVTISVAQDKALRVTSTIAEVQHLVDPKTQMVGAVVLLPAGRQASLLSGMRVQAAIELGERQAWSVPRQAVLTDDQGAYLYQVAKDKARRVNVSKLLENGTALGVDGKLDASLPVVVLGNYELQDGMSVRGDAR